MSSSQQATTNLIVTVAAIAVAAAAVVVILNQQRDIRTRSERAEDKANSAKRNASKAIDDAGEAASEGINAVRSKVAKAINP